MCWRAGGSVPDSCIYISLSLAVIWHVARRPCSLCVRVGALRPCPLAAMRSCWTVAASTIDCWSTANILRGARSGAVSRVSLRLRTEAAPARARGVLYGGTTTSTRTVCSALQLQSSLPVATVPRPPGRPRPCARSFSVSPCVSAATHGTWLACDPSPCSPGGAWRAAWGGLAAPHTWWRL